MSFNSFNLTASPTTPFNNPSFTPSPYPIHDFIISPPPHGLALGLHNHSSFTTHSPRVLPATEVPNVGRRSKKLKQISLYDIIVDPTVVFGTAYKKLLRLDLPRQARPVAPWNKIVHLSSSQ